ncbi:MAG: hypothetical protein SFT81_01720 [Candidatus Caenarcaniphilales bacterium]|nr:hypothetical protein [Candidatus Caenarcaniphilales bacterium]
MQISIELFNRAEELAYSEHQREALDMLKCIQAYRVCPSFENLIKYRPKLVHQMDDIYRLWKKFNRMSKEEISILAFKLIDEI